MEDSDESYGTCPICNTSIELSLLQVHVNMCLDGQEDDGNNSPIIHNINNLLELSYSFPDINNNLIIELQNELPVVNTDKPLNPHNFALENGLLFIRLLGITGINKNCRELAAELSYAGNNIIKHCGAIHRAVQFYDIFNGENLILDYKFNHDFVFKIPYFWQNSEILLKLKSPSTCGSYFSVIGECKIFLREAKVISNIKELIDLNTIDTFNLIPDLYSLKNVYQKLVNRKYYNFYNGNKNSKIICDLLYLNISECSNVLAFFISTLLNSFPLFSSISRNSNVPQYILSSVNEYNIAPIHLSCQVGYIDIIRYLCSRLGSENISIPDKKGRSIIFYCIQGDLIHHSAFRTLTVIAEYFELEQLINIEDLDGNTPLHYIASLDENKVNFKEIIRLLIMNYASLDKKNSKGHTPLMNAVRNNNISISRSLIEEYNAKIYLKDNMNIDVLTIAIENNNEEIIKMLLDNHIFQYPYCLDLYNALLSAISSDLDNIIKIMIAPLTYSQRRELITNAINQNKITNNNNISSEITDQSSKNDSKLGLLLNKLEEEESNNHFPSENSIINNSSLSSTEYQVITDNNYTYAE